VVQRRHDHDLKLLNGCGVNNRCRAFGSVLTNLEATITATDNIPGFQTDTYQNPQETAFLPMWDTSAFVTCP
jgi:hypothetical protein